MDFSDYSLVIWDWNGTLLDDVDWSIQIMNKLLYKRNMPQLSGRMGYYDYIDMPMVNYYKNLGFDFSKESFQELSGEFLTQYFSFGHETLKLRAGAEQCIKSLSEQGVKQVILSASEISCLKRQLSLFSIEHHFSQILGMGDSFARSKIEIAMQHIYPVESRAIIVGDTFHDYAVSLALNIDCALIAGGHDSKEKLSGCDASVYDSLIELVKIPAVNV